jgi:hypothetical protein
VVEVVVLAELDNQVQTIVTPVQAVWDDKVGSQVKAAGMQAVEAVAITLDTLTAATAV